MLYRVTCVLVIECGRGLLYAGDLEYVYTLPHTITFAASISFISELFLFNAPTF